MSVRQLTLLWSLVLLFSASICAQTTSLSGSVRDNSGAVIPAVSVQLRNTATGVSFSAQTNESGFFVFPTVPPGAYEVSCELQGFKRFVQTGITLDTGFSRNVDITLEVGAVSETVEVTSSAPLLETQNSTIGQFIERTQVMNMPIESRRSASLVRLMGAVTFSAETGGEQVPVFSMAGGRSQNQMWTLDGGITQNMALGIAQLSLNPPAESLQEFKAEMSNYSAELGRTGSGFIMMTTRSGTNQLHGAAYHFLRNDALDARTFFAARKAPLRYNIFGTSLGGPIKRDKTFFFFNYEGARRRDGVTVSNTNVPHPFERTGDFSRRTDVRILDPLTYNTTTRTAQQFPGNVIPVNRLDPVGRAMAALYPDPNVASDPTRAGRFNYLVNVSDKLTQDYYTTRVDHNIGTNDRVFGRYSYVQAPQDVASVFPTVAADSRAGIRENRHHNALGSWIHNFKPTLLNEVRYMYGNRLHINRAAGTGSGLNSQVGVKGVNQDAFARVNVTGLTPLGSGNHERIQSPILTNQITDTLTWLKGNHQVKFGFDFRYSRNKDDLNQSMGGNFTFNNRATNEGLATLLLGYTTSAALLDTDLLDTRTDYYGAFVQDDWKVSSKLTLNLGLRWEMDTPRWERTDNRQSGFAINQINPVSGVPGAVQFSGRNGLSKYAHDFDPNNFGPRFGFAYRPAGTWVVRGGYGISYNGIYARAVPNILNLGFANNLSFNSPDGGLTQTFFLASGMPTGVREELGPGFGAVRLGQAARVAPDLLQANQLTGYAQQWNMTIQKELGFNSVLEVGYLANVGHKLGGPDVNLNMIPLVDGRGPAAQSQQARRFPHFNDVLLRSPAWGNSAYHAMNVRWEKRYSGGLNFLMNYTWSKFLDDVEAAGELGGEANNGYTHVELRRLDRSLSGNDVRHRYIGSMVYELPFGKGRRTPISNPILNAIAGGWGLGVIFEARAGVPYGVIEQLNLSNTFSHGQRPNLTCDPAISGSRSRAEMIAQYFDVNCFQAPGQGIFGNAPRNQGIGPGFLNLDLSSHKYFNITETWRIQFRADFFNLPNRPQFANPGLARGGPGFGQIGSTLGGSTGRQMQFSLRLEF